MEKFCESKKVQSQIELTKELLEGEKSAKEKTYTLEEVREHIKTQRFEK